MADASASHGNAAGGRDGGSSSSKEMPEQQSASSSRGGRAVLDHMLRDKMEALLWLSRLATIAFAVLYLLPFSSGAYGHYQRALLSAAVSSSIRLNQRLPQVQLSRAFFTQLVSEDSFHYLCFAFIFLNMSGAVSLALMPVTLFAALHVVKYTRQVLDLLRGPSSFALLRSVLSKVETNQAVLLRFVACAEIFMMPTTLLLVVSGQAVFVLPFIYYRFLRFRYNSARNPYCKAVVADMHRRAEELCEHRYCPSFFRSALLRFGSAASGSRAAAAGPHTPQAGDAPPAGGAPHAAAAAGS